MSKKSGVVVKKPIQIELSKAEAAHIEKLLSKTTADIVPTDSLKPNPQNPKRHPENQVALLAENIRKFGQTQPILVDENNIILAGHGRHLAAQRLAMADVLVIRLTHLSAAEKRALAISDNKLSELGSWDIDQLRVELQDLTNPAIDLDFDPLILGFDTVEIDQILDAGEANEKPDLDDELPDMPAEAMPVTRTGDLWICGPHRLFCGNALERESYAALLGSERAQIVFTDFRMNVPNMDEKQFATFLEVACSRLAEHAERGAVIYIGVNWRHVPQLWIGAANIFGAPKNVIVWVKTNVGRECFYRSAYENILVFVAGNTTPVNNFQLGERGRLRTNVWKYPEFNTLGRDEQAMLALHPTLKPVAVVADALHDCSRRGDFVLDSFAGAGTTMIAAERVGRVARLMEVDELYCDTILRRWQKLTNTSAQLAPSGKTFEAVMAERNEALAYDEGQPHAE